MMQPSDITALLGEVERGNREVVGILLPMLYDELQVLARRQLGESRPGQTLDTKALVQQAYHELVKQDEASFPNRQHFFTLASKAMRQIVVDHARRRRAGGKEVPAQTLLTEALGETASIDEQAEALLVLDRALARLGTLDERLVQVMELRFFGGLSVEETASALEVPSSAVVRDSRIARVYLYLELERHAV